MHPLPSHDARSCDRPYSDGRRGARSAADQRAQQPADRARVDAVLLLEALGLLVAREREDELLPGGVVLARGRVEQAQRLVLDEAAEAAGLRQLPFRGARVEDPDRWRRELVVEDGVGRGEPDR